MRFLPAPRLAQAPVYVHAEVSYAPLPTPTLRQGDGKKIDGRRVLVDVERGRTVRNWRPRRLAGGLGSTRGGNKRPETAPSAPRDTESVAGGSFGGGGGGSGPPPPPAMGGGGGGSGGSSYGGGGGGGSQAGGKLQWATERRGPEDRGKGYGGRDERDRGREDRASYRDDRDRGGDRSREARDRRGGSRERGRDDRDRGRERGDRDR